MTTTLKNKNVKLTKADLIGSWQLIEFLIEDHSGLTNKWGEGSTGLLFYNSDNYMSVSINKIVGSNSEIEEKNFFDSILFYSGIFKTESIDQNCLELLNNPFANSHTVVKHCVQQASNPKRIGKELLRYIGFTKTSKKDIYLTLSAPVESFGRGVIRWKKITL